MSDRPLGTEHHAYLPTGVRTRSAWWRWRHARPFWGGLLVTLGGAEILVTVKAPLPVIVHVGMQGLAGYLVPIVLLLCGILLLANPSQRLFYSIVAAVMTLASWVTSNLGGFMLGLLLGLIGSALAFAWSPSKAARHKPAHVGPVPEGPAPTDPALTDPAATDPAPSAAALGLAELGLGDPGHEGPQSAAPDKDDLDPAPAAESASAAESAELADGEPSGADREAGSAARRE